jgi:general secretion pathway protein F
MKKYKISYQEKEGIQTSIIESDNLLEEELPLNIISIQEQNTYLSITKLFEDKTIKDKEIQLLFYELNIMLESKITLLDALDILIKNKKSKNIIRLLESIKSAFSSSTSISASISEFKINYLVGAFFDISKDSGNISENIKALSVLLSQSMAIKKKFIKSMSYPFVLLVSFFLSLFSIFSFVIPKFKIIFEQTTAELPLATKILLEVQYLFENYSFYIGILFFLSVLIIIFLYSRNENLKYFLHKFIVKDFYLIKDVYFNMQMYKVFLMLDIMLKSNYEFHKALISSKVLLRNKYLLDKICEIDNLLQNGKGISFSFSNADIFDDIVLNLINTGEVSNSLDITVNEIKNIYKNRFDDKINILTSMIEPIFLLCIMSLILWIVLAVFMPIWDMGNLIKV